MREALFAPRSVAIVGQSDDAGKATGRPLQFLRQAGYGGRIYPVNPRRETVLGERAWPSLAALPEPPDHAYIVTATEAAVAAVEECGRAGVKVATVLADGFAEIGAEGLAREQRLRDTCARTRIRLVGPSSLGVVDLRSKAMLTANAAFAANEWKAGRIFAASHSGSLIGTLFSRGHARGIAFAGLVSVGNEVDLSLGEICEATLDDPDIDGYMLFLETLRHADALRRFALTAAARGKPILAYKIGRSTAARELAVTHTGALAGEDEVADAFFRACGIARVDTLDGLIEGLPLLARVPPASNGARNRVGVVTTTGGGAAMMVDLLARRGLTIMPPSTATLARLAAAGLAIKPGPLVDLTVAGARYDTMRAALDVLTAAPEFDLVLAVAGSSARPQPQATVQPIIDCAAAGKPLAAFVAPEAPEGLAMLSAAGVPNFRTPEACADAIAAALGRHPPSSSWPGSSRRSTSPTLTLPRKREREGRGQDVDARAKPGHDGVGGLLDERAAGLLLDRLEIARAPSIALDADIARPPQLPFDYPVALKVLTGEIAHKTDVGAVVLDVGDGAALLAAIKTVRASVAERMPDTAVSRVLVQPMISGLGEVLLGYRVDRDVGPFVMLAAGGVLAEIARDRSLRLAPVDLTTAREMIGEVRALAALAGYRSQRKGDLAALAQAIVALSGLADDSSVLEAEINPLIVRGEGEGVVAVDALVKLAGNT